MLLNLVNCEIHLILTQTMIELVLPNKEKFRNQSCL